MHKHHWILSQPQGKHEETFTASTPYNPHHTGFKATLLRPYQAPTNKDMLVVLPLFNPCNSLRIVQNLLFVASKLDLAGIPYVIAHCLFPDSMPIMPVSDKYRTYTSSSYAFMKESLANVVIKHSVERYAKFLVLDGDVVFESRTWYDAVSTSLDAHDVVQPYTDYCTLDSNFVTPLSSGQGIVSVVQKDPKLRRTRGHPGYAVAFTRSFFQTTGYPCEALLGGGDTLIYSIALGIRLFEDQSHEKHLGYLYDKYRGEPIETNCVPGTIYHLYHNTTANRQYASRYYILHKYIGPDKPYSNIDELVCFNKDGLCEWIEPVREDLNREVLDYFSSRKDDEVE